LSMHKWYQDEWESEPSLCRYLSFSLSPAVKMGYVPTLGPICDDRGPGKISTFATVEGLRMSPESLKNT